VTYRDTLAARDALHAIAARQGGYVTSAQARGAGYGHSHLSYHLGTGHLERVGHGLYRVRAMPLDEHDELIRLALWSRDRSGQPRAVVSHDTALLLHDLSDVLPGQTHLSVPPQFRKPTPKNCVLHVARVEASDLRPWTVFSVTTAGRTLADAADSATVTTELLTQAVTQALRRGLVTAKEMSRRAAADPAGRLVLALDTVTGSRGKP